MAILSLLCIAARDAQAPSNAFDLTLESDRTIRVRILSDLSSRSARAGQSFGVSTIDDVYVDGVLVVPKNSLGKGSIVAARRARSFWRRGRLQLTIASIVAPDGTVIPVVLPGGAGGPAETLHGRHGPFGFFGDDVVISCGTITTVLVAEDTNLRAPTRDELISHPKTPLCGRSL
ncbi:MAG TPA: hypothetical protein VKT51_08590 [Candidatus Eremiobacteraceae bacterium]|nr:hypothetical protein [Candidatus Eremiobacteraceae bacterium]